MERISGVANDPSRVNPAVDERRGEWRDFDWGSQNQAIVPVILCGGGGTRLWPFSTSETPKQFQPLFGAGRTLFRQTLDRVNDRKRFAAPFIVASARHADTCEGELAIDEGGATLILEPCGRNTAPAILLAALGAADASGGDPLLLVMPSDHVIEDVGEFHAAIAAGYPAAASGKLVTFGIEPSTPETGFGYLQIGGPMPGCGGVSAVARFVEKPSLEAAERMVAAGDHLWNAGIFLFQASAIIAEAEKFAPEMVQATRKAMESAERTGIRILPSAEAFGACRSESIDYAVMEHSDRVAVVPMSPGWSDLGSWDALAGLMGGNAPVGPVSALDCENCYMLSDGLQVAALGVRDLIIVASGGRLLIMPKGRSQEVKKLLSAMEPKAA